MGTLRLTGETSGYTELAAPSVAGDNTITLPAASGTANALLKNSGTPGTLEYSSITEDGSGGLSSVASINSGPLAGFRNAIINGNFDIWQRGRVSLPSHTERTGGPTLLSDRLAR